MVEKRRVLRLGKTEIPWDNLELGIISTWNPLHTTTSPTRPMSNDKKPKVLIVCLGLLQSPDHASK